MKCIHKWFQQLSVNIYKPSSKHTYRFVSAMKCNAGCLLLSELHTMNKAQMQSCLCPVNPHWNLCVSIKTTEEGAT